MSEIRKFKNGEFSPPIQLDGESWRIASEVAKVAGFRDAARMARRLPAHQRRRYVIRTAGGPQLMWIISHEGLRFILGRSRNINARSAAEELGLGMTWASPIETDAMRIIAAAVAHLDPVPQYSVGPYRVDLYLRAARIAVECDEIGHVDKDAVLDGKRQAFIEAELSCQFVRFDPQSHGFNIGNVIAEIIAPQPARSMRREVRRRNTACTTRDRETKDSRFVQECLQIEDVSHPMAEVNR
jgi:very-short-patch-repair endonuclease